MQTLHESNVIQYKEEIPTLTLSKEGVSYTLIELFKCTGMGHIIKV